MNSSKSFPFSLSSAFVPSLLVLSIAVLVAVFSVCQLMTKIENVHEMMGKYGRSFADTERRFISAMALLRPQRRRRIASGGPGSQLAANLCQCEESRGDKCPPGKPGKKGKRGQKGTAGSPGLPGVPGLRGNQPPVQFDFEFRCRICPMGEPGEPGKVGDSGENGSPGPKGPPGRPGKPGLTGERGSVGAEGEKGMSGKMGKKGSRGKAALKGESGQKGEKGEDGQAGSTGRPGVAGRPGKDGANGKPRKAGKRGKVGRKGSPGERGTTGPIGEPGRDRFYCPCPKERLPDSLLQQSPSTGYSPKTPHGRPRAGHKKGKLSQHHRRVHEVALGTENKA